MGLSLKEWAEVVAGAFALALSLAFMSAVLYVAEPLIGGMP